MRLLGKLTNEPTVVECPACLGCGTSTKPPLPANIRDGAELLAWADRVGAQTVPCAACAGSGRAKAGAA